MKKSVLLFALVLLIAAPLSAQNPSADTIPQLQEWWRADNMQYGKYGMTWLDNFYNGKGALVVWTPNGVQTWLLRFPGDTMNVFTWEKGSSNIKTGDFNGDGITDYVDENSNIYEGVKNGEPPKSEAVPLKISVDESNYPDIIHDVNNDGYADMIIFSPDNSYKSHGEMRISFGNKILDSMRWQRIALKDIDSNNVPVASYKVNEREMRVICGHTYWTNNVNFPFRTVYKDGLRLVRVWWDGTGFKSEILDEFTVDTKDGTGLYWVSALLPQPQGKNYFVCATQILGKVENSDLTIYDISNDKLERKHNQKIDRIAGGGINSFRYGLDSTGIPSLCIRRYNELSQPVLHIYNGNTSSTLKEIAQFKITQYPNLPITGLISVPDVTGDEKSDIALSNRLTLTLLNSKYVSSVIEVQENRVFSIQPLPPIPSERSGVIQIKIIIAKSSSYNLSMYDSLGKRIISKIIQIEKIGENFINLDLSQFPITSGTYTLQLEGNGNTAHCSIIIQ